MLERVNTRAARAMLDFLHAHRAARKFPAGIERRRGGLLGVGHGEVEGGF
jgi:hypothetical protein